LTIWPSSSSVPTAMTSMIIAPPLWALPGSLPHPSGPYPDHRPTPLGPTRIIAPPGSSPHHSGLEVGPECRGDLDIDPLPRPARVEEDHPVDLGCVPVGAADRGPVLDLVDQYFEAAPDLRLVGEVGDVVLDR